MFKISRAVGALMVGAATMVAASQWGPGVSAQRGEDWEWQGSYERLTRLNAGTFITVRTTQPISINRADGQRFSGAVAEDVWDDYGRLAVPAIPRGSRVDMVVRTADDGGLILDLESVYAHNQRYAVDAVSERIQTDNRPRDNHRAEYIGGGAILGTIIGAIAGGGKGAAIGAGSGAAVGLGLAYQGRSIRIPAGSMLTFRLDQGLFMDSRRGNGEGSYYRRR